jgi:NTP pyrophosphatase (non-canonical NTP hydrolase)
MSIVQFVDDYQKWALGKWFASEELQNKVGEPMATELIAAFGIGGEAGEFLEKVKKEHRGDGITPDEQIKELGDILFYIAIYADAKGYTLSEVFEANIIKLDDRHARGAQQGSGDNR